MDVEGSQARAGECSTDVIIQPALKLAGKGKESFPQITQITQTKKTNG